jgi:hypothetical protein
MQELFTVQEKYIYNKSLTRKEGNKHKQKNQIVLVPKNKTETAGRKQKQQHSSKN